MKRLLIVPAILIFSVSLMAQNITGYEYFFDSRSDAAYSATLVNPSPQALIKPDIPTQSLADGLHSVTIMFIDSNGKRSSPVTQTFFKSTSGGVYEYWFDNDIDNRAKVGFTSRDNAFIDGKISTGTLSEGLHTFHLRASPKGTYWSSTVSQQVYKGNGTGGMYEYWFDEDLANRTTINVTSTNNLLVVNGVVTGSLTEGLHTFHLRASPTGAYWTSTISQQIYKGNSAGGAYEYWYDDKFGEREKISLGRQNNISVIASLNTSSITEGFHTFHLRASTDGNYWSGAVSRMVYIGDTDGEALEYWFDNDFNGRVKLSSFGNPVTADIDAKNLEAGLHVVHVRLKPKGAAWTAPISEFFMKGFSGGSSSSDKLVSYQYWYDGNDGTRRDVSFSSPAADIFFVDSLPTYGLSKGSHTVSIRFKDELNLWSPVADGIIGVNEIAPDATEVHAMYEGKEVTGAFVYVDRGGGSGFQLEGTTTIEQPGVILTDLKGGEKIKVAYEVLYNLAVKKGHELLGNTKYELWVDSDVMDWDGYYSSFQIREIIPSINLEMTHYEFRYNLLASAEWDLSDEEFLQFVKGFKSASEYLYNVSDGQIRLNKIVISDNKIKWNNADIQIYRSHWPESYVFGINFETVLDQNTQKIGNACIFLGQTFEGSTPDQQHYYRTITHEFGHYALGFYDEYLNGYGNQTAWKKIRENNPEMYPSDYGFMDYQDYTTEASSSNDYPMDYELLTQTRKSKQLYERGVPCWEFLDKCVKDFSTKNNLNISLTCPVYGNFDYGKSYDRLGPQDYHIFDVTQVIDDRPLNKSAGNENSGAEIILKYAGKPIINASVYAETALGISYMGQSDKNGKVNWPGAKSGTRINIYALSDGIPQSFSTVISEIKAENLINLPNAKSLKGSLTEVSDIPGINITGNVSFGSSLRINLELFSDHQLSKAPDLKISYGNSTALLTITDVKDMIKFAGTVTIDTSDELFDGTGIIEITCTYNNTDYKSVSYFELFSGTDTDGCEIFNRSFNLNIGRENFSGNQAGISFSTYGKPFLSAGQSLYPITDVFSVKISNLTDYADYSGFNVDFAEKDVSGIDLSTLGIYKWNESSYQWEYEQSTLANLQDKLVSCYVMSTGMYCVFATGRSNDTIPPSKIYDFLAITGKGQAMIDLSWSAPGDDGTIGKAAYYIIKFNTVPINDLNWDSSNKIDIVPSPSDYGTKETLSLRMPKQNELFYFAIKAVDEAGNMSEISINTSAVSGVQIYTFSLVSPSFNSVVNDLSPTLEWEKYIDEEVLSYTLMIADNDLFENAVSINDISAVSYKIQSLLNPGRSYFWKVIAHTKSGKTIDCNQSYLRFLTFGITGNDDNKIPDKGISYCYPNPFNPTYQYGTIRFPLKGSETFTAAIFDINGKQIKSIVRENNRSDSEGVIFWDGTDASGRKVQEGMYIYLIRTGNGTKISGKILISP